MLTSPLPDQPSAVSPFTTASELANRFASSQHVTTQSSTASFEPLLTTTPFSTPASSSDYSSPYKPRARAKRGVHHNLASQPHSLSSSLSSANTPHVTIATPQPLAGKWDHFIQQVSDPLTEESILVVILDQIHSDLQRHQLKLQQHQREQNEAYKRSLRQSNSSLTQASYIYEVETSYQELDNWSYHECVNVINHTLEQHWKKKIITSKVFTILPLIVDRIHSLLDFRVFLENCVWPCLHEYMTDEHIMMSGLLLLNQIIRTNNIDFNRHVELIIATIIHYQRSSPIILERAYVLLSFLNVRLDLARADSKHYEHNKRHGRFVEAHFIAVIRSHFTVITFGTLQYQMESDSIHHSPSSWQYISKMLKNVMLYRVGNRTENESRRRYLAEPNKLCLLIRFMEMQSSSSSSISSSSSTHVANTTSATGLSEYTADEKMTAVTQSNICQTLFLMCFVKFPTALALLEPTEHGRFKQFYGKIDVIFAKLQPAILQQAKQMLSSATRHLSEAKYLVDLMSAHLDDQLVVHFLCTCFYCYEFFTLKNTEVEPLLSAGCWDNMIEVIKRHATSLGEYVSHLSVILQHLIPFYTTWNVFAREHADWFYDFMATVDHNGDRSRTRAIDFMERVIAYTTEICPHYHHYSSQRPRRTIAHHVRRT